MPRKGRKENRNLRESMKFGKVAVQGGRLKPQWCWGQTWHLSCRHLVTSAVQLNRAQGGWRVQAVPGLAHLPASHLKSQPWELNPAKHLGCVGHCRECLRWHNSPPAPSQVGLFISPLRWVMNLSKADSLCHVTADGSVAPAPAASQPPRLSRPPRPHCGSV